VEFVKERLIDISWGRKPDVDKFLDENGNKRAVPPPDRERAQQALSRRWGVENPPPPPWAEEEERDAMADYPYARRPAWLAASAGARTEREEAHEAPRFRQEAPRYRQSPLEASYGDGCKQERAEASALAAARRADSGRRISDHARVGDRAPHGDLARYGGRAALERDETPEPQLERQLERQSERQSERQLEPQMLADLDLLAEPNLLGEEDSHDEPRLDVYAEAAAEANARANARAAAGRSARSAEGGSLPLQGGSRQGPSLQGAPLSLEGELDDEAQEQARKEWLQYYLQVGEWDKVILSTLVFSAICHIPFFPFVTRPICLQGGRARGER
jgi:hypothetical protein